MKRIISATALLLVMLSMPVVWADKVIPNAVQKVIDKVLSTNPDSVKESEIQGIYEVRQKGNLFYIDAQGRFMVFGNNLIDPARMQNLTEESQRRYRKKTLLEVSDKELLIFKPADPKHRIYVFTDVECGYCRRLHQNIDKIMSMGVEVRYLFAPFRGDLAYDKATGVWCSNDRQQAMTRAKQGRNIDLRQCPTPIAKHMKLVEAFGINGTPMIILEHGTAVNGYVEPEELLQLIRKDQITANS